MNSSQGEQAAGPGMARIVAGLRIGRNEHLPDAGSQSSIL